MSGVLAMLNHKKNIYVLNFHKVLLALFKKIKSICIICIPDVCCLNSISQKECLQSRNIKSFLAVPIIFKAEVLGFISLETVRQKKAWSSKTINLLKAVAKMLADLLNRQGTAALLQKQKRQINSLVSALPGVIFKAQKETNFLMDFLDISCLELTGYLPEELTQSNQFNYSNIIYSEDIQVRHLAIQKALDKRCGYEIEYRIITKNQQQKWLREKGNPSEDLESVEGLIIDITKSKQIEEALRQAERNYNSICENITHGYFQADKNYQYLKVNKVFAQMLGYNSSAAMINHFREITHRAYVKTEYPECYYSQLDKAEKVINFQAAFYRQDGSIIWLSENTRAVYDQQGNFVYYEGTVEDITARRLTEAQLLYNSLHDTLIGLPNRHLLREDLEILLKYSANNKNFFYAVLFIDLDQFKLVNNSFGHLVGDELLKQVTRRLQIELRPQDKMARFSGDAFVILLVDVANMQEVESFAKRIRERMKLPFQLEQGHIFTSASIGITCNNLNYRNADELLRDADIALYEAKSKGQGCYTFFNPQMQKIVLARHQLENDLRYALEKQEFSLYYQPIVELKTRRLQGFEALIRWYHPVRGWISPSQFIPIAEATGLIHPLGDWVLRTACQQLNLWREQYPQAEALQMNLNLSVHQLKEVDLVERIKALLEIHQLPSQVIKLEITESAFLETVTNQDAVVERLKELGLGLCIDDFGTGYSSLSRLHEFPVDTLKVDRSFIKSMETGQTAIIQTIITLGQALGMNVVAEGIETPEQLDTLRDLQCEYGQGYLFSKPVDSSQASKLITGAVEI
jgi:diguanylate cyclase (GGDEF)-like protein/PAS domain S-box-containing protein